MAALIERAREGEPGFALLFIDLDHFKRVNDSLGHVVGDTLLQTAARRIASSLRADDLVARFGGDEFVVVLTGAPPPSAVREVADKLVAAVGEAVQVLGQDISVTPSIGVAMYPQHGSHASELIKHADTAMYHAKASGRAAYSFFEPQMAAAVIAELALEGRLAQAVRDREFRLHFQPQLSLSTGTLVGFEALIRWQHPQRGLVNPADFLPVAEARRLILPIGDWVLDEALRCTARWREMGLVHVPVAVNLSGAQLRAAGFIDGIEQALSRHPGALLELEFTERMLMDDTRVVQGLLARLKDLGVRIAVDDFGTGYSSLGHLMNLPIDRLKIDRSFVHSLPIDRGAAAIARAIIQMAHGLSIGVVAEGVESAAQRDWIAAQGCDEVQGYLTGRPMAPEQFEQWLKLRARGAATSEPSSAAASRGW